MDARRISQDGMSGLPIMPFPAFNPWNWGALTPARIMASNIVAFRCALDLWRSGADAMNAAMRQQQDAMLKAIEAQLLAAPNAPPAASPMLSIADAYVKMGDALLGAQQELMAKAAKPIARQR